MSDDTQFYTYPMQVGNQWHYKETLTRTNFDPDSLASEYGFSEISYVNSKVLGTEILRDSIETLILGISSPGEPDVYASRDYYKATDEGLFIIAYSNAGGSLIYPKKPTSATIQFKSYRFKDMQELSEFVQRALPLSKSVSDSIIFEEPPVQTLKYPLTVGSQWTYRADYSPWRIDKTVIGRKTIYVDIGAFYCYHIKWLYDWDHNGTWDEDIWIDDYLSDEGLIKRTISYIGVIFVDDIGNYSGSFDVIQDYVLTEIYY